MEGPKSTSGGHKDIRTKALLEVPGGVRVQGCCRPSPTASCEQDRHTDSAGDGVPGEAAECSSVLFNSDSFGLQEGLCL